MTQVVEINAIEQLESIRLRWTSLFYETRSASFFHSFDWLQIYWRQFRNQQRLKVLLVHRAGSILGILPLVVREEGTSAGPTQTLTYPIISRNHPLGPIGPNPTATLMASLRHLANGRRDWEVLSLTSIGAHDCGRTENALRLADFHIDACPAETGSRIAFDENRSGASLNSEASVEQVRVCKEALKFERVRSTQSNYDANAELSTVADACIDLANESSVACDITPPRDLFRAMMVTAHRLGMLDLNLLRRRNRLIAFSFNVHFKGVIRQVCAASGSEPADLAAGNELTSRMVRDSDRRGDVCLYYATSDARPASGLASEEISTVRYEHHAMPSIHVRLGRMKRWWGSTPAGAIVEN